MSTTTTTHPTQAAVRRGLIKGKKAADALSTLTNTCTTGSGCTQVQNDPVASKALGVLQAAVTTSLGSQSTRNKAATAFTLAKRTASADFRSVQTALYTYETSVGAVAQGNATIITAAGCLSRDESSPALPLETVTGLHTKPGKLPMQAIVGWPEAPGASSYALEVNWTPQSATATWTAIGSGTGRRWVVTAPAVGAQFLVRVAAQGSHGEQSAWSNPVLATAR
jgi:hypothetical protein